MNTFTRPIVYNTHFENVYCGSEVKLYSLTALRGQITLNSRNLSFASNFFRLSDQVARLKWSRIQFNSVVHQENLLWILRDCAQSTRFWRIPQMRFFMAVFSVCFPEVLSPAPPVLWRSWRGTCVLRSIVTVNANYTIGRARERYPNVTACLILPSTVSYGNAWKHFRRDCHTSEKYDVPCDFERMEVVSGFS